jgi:hypothetical protein
MANTFRNINILEKTGITWSHPINLDYSPLPVSSDNQNHDVMIYQDDSIDLSWFKKQADFLKSLNEREQFILRTYSRNGDEVVNSLMRLKNIDTLKSDLMRTVNHLKTLKNGIPRVNIFHPVDLKTITPKNVIQIATKYVNELFDIFNKAPSIETQLRVFRGIKPDLGKDPVIYPLAGITSTSYNPLIIEGFTTNYENFKKINQSWYGMLQKERESLGKEILKNCCVLDMILRPGVKAIWLEPVSEFQNEQEIILLPTIIQASYSHPHQKVLYNPDKNQITEYQTYDVVVTPIIGKTFTMGGRRTKRSKRTHRKTIKKYKYS